MARSLNCGLHQGGGWQEVLIWIKGGRLGPCVSDVLFFKVVSWFLMVFGWFPWFFKVVSRWFHGFWLVSMVFQGGCMVFHGFWLVSIVLLVQNTTNCILAQRSILGLAGRRPALA